MPDPRNPMPSAVPMSVSVVIPTLNEARNIGWVLERMPSFVDELIIVDGRSTDDTVKVAKMLAPNVVVVREDRPGKGAAMQAGLFASAGARASAASE